MRRYHVRDNALLCVAYLEQRLKSIPLFGSFFEIDVKSNPRLLPVGESAKLEVPPKCYPDNPRLSRKTFSRLSPGAVALVMLNENLTPLVLPKLFRLGGKGHSNEGRGIGKSNNGGKRGRRASRGGSFAEASLNAKEHGMVDFRLISRWSFFTQPLREPQERKKTSIGVRTRWREGELWGGGGGTNVDT